MVRNLAPRRPPRTPRRLHDGAHITHWHGTYEVAKHFYSEFIPQLEDLIKSGRESADAEKNKAAEALQLALL